MAATSPRPDDCSPGAPQPFIDLSMGNQPVILPPPLLGANVFEHLPDFAAQIRLSAIAAQTYGAPTAAHVVCAPGTQVLLPLVAGLVPAGRAVILGPTYSEHARAAAHAGHAVLDARDIEELRGADLGGGRQPEQPRWPDHRQRRAARIIRRAECPGRPSAG